jgi:type IV secretory pathway TraG/TraD family ATPase VirD4
MASLEIRGEQLALDVLDGVSRTSEHTRSGIFSTASSVLSAYNSAGALRVCANPNFDVNAFVRSHDTVYISAPAHQQTRLAPLVVGLLEQIRNATYARARDGHLGTPPLLWALDEVANIAPLRALPSLVSEGGGQGLQVIACFQDLAQARARWGAAADGFISLFGTKLVFGGIGDLETLRALSAFVGNWDRPYSSVSTSRSKTRHRSDPVFFGASRTSGVSVTNWVQREAILSEGDIATVPRGRALMLRAGWWGLVSIEPYFVSPCWRNVLAHAPHAIVQH